MNKSIIITSLMMLSGFLISLTPFIPHSWVVNLQCWYYRVFTKTISLDIENNLLNKMDEISFDSHTRYIYIGKNKLRKIN